MKEDGNLGQSLPQFRRGGRHCSLANGNSLLSGGGGSGGRYFSLIDGGYLSTEMEKYGFHGIVHVIHAGGEFFKKTVFIMDVNRGTCTVQ